MDAPSELALRIEHTDTPGRGAFFVARDGKRIAEMVYKHEGERLITVTHTEVDPSLRGRGVARTLLDALVTWARATGTRVKATCPYARGQLEKDASIRDVHAG